MPVRLLVALWLLLFAVAPGAAQILVQPIHPPVERVEPRVPEVQAQGTSPGELVYQDPEALKAQINALKREKRALREQLAVTLADLQQLRVQLDEMTRAGGSLVTAQCMSPTLSRNTAGPSEDCAASGYRCAAVSGLCHRSCTTTDMCAAGFVCDTAESRCVPPPAGD